MIIGGLRDQKLQHRKAQKGTICWPLSSNGPWIRSPTQLCQALMLLYIQQIICVQINLCFLKTERTLGLATGRCLFLYQVLPGHLSLSI